MSPENNQKIDFTSLDPTSNASHFDRLVRSVMARTQLRRPLSAKMLALQWRRPALALAACLALAAWAPSLFHTRSSSIETSTVDPAQTFLQWTEKGEPSATEVLDLLGRAP